MSGENSPAFREGQEYAYDAIIVVREYVDSLSETDRLQWWGGFLSTAVGAMVESVGEPARQALEELLTRRS